MMKDPLKVVKRIINNPLPEKKNLSGVYLIRDVVRVIGIMATVKSRGHPMEPRGTYTVWLDTPDMYTSTVSRALHHGETVTVGIQLIDDRWEVLEFHTPVTYETATVEQVELQAQRSEYATYANY